MRREVTRFQMAGSRINGNLTKEFYAAADKAVKRKVNEIVKLLLKQHLWIRVKHKRVGALMMKVT